jgi:hypothetical protein
MTVTTTQHCSVILPENYLPGIGVDPKLDEIISCATKAALHVYGNDWFVSGNKRNKRLIESVARMDRPLFSKSQFRPLVVGRYLAFHSLTELGWIDREVAAIFGLHRTSVLHGLSVIRDRQFKPDVNEAYNYYNEILT